MKKLLILLPFIILLVGCSEQNCINGTKIVSYTEMDYNRIERKKHHFNNINDMFNSINNDIERIENIGYICGGIMNADRRYYVVCEKEITRQREVCKSD